MKTNKHFHAEIYNATPHSNIIIIWSIKNEIKFVTEIVGNKAKRRIKNECFKKTNQVNVCVSGGKKCSFSENSSCSVFLKHPLWDSPFCVIFNEIWNHFRLIYYLFMFSGKKEDQMLYLLRFFIISKMLKQFEMCSVTLTFHYVQKVTEKVYKFLITGYSNVSYTFLDMKS